MRISSNYGLKLMEGTDNVKRQDFVDNFSKIDTEMRAIENEAYPIVEATGTNAYIGANVRIQSLKKGTKLTLFAGVNANGNCSLNLNSYGTKNIKDSNGNIVTNMKANIPYNLCYNGTDFILQGKGGGGNLIPKYLLAGYYGEGDNGRVDGAMVNRGAPTSNLNCGGVVNLQEGYYAGGQIIASSLESQTPSNADASKIVSGYHAWINGRDVWGTATIQSMGGVEHATDKYFLYCSPTISLDHDSKDNRTNTTIIDIPFEPSIIIGRSLSEPSAGTTGEYQYTYYGSANKYTIDSGNGFFLYTKDQQYGINKQLTRDSRTQIRSVAYSNGQLTVSSNGTYGGSNYRYIFMILAYK
ncbi:hypothetical protein ONV75_08755 [Clostridium sp. LQ25]|uniref:hypothetical protein n=1 Tax=Clostridium TaxID=1485 RepID=UPI0006977E9C|nr:MULTISPECIES: hypothetical protein [Clostridium]UZT07945.1 hypothetical protein ONV75_08755 [Clostridium sp. LQ25]